MVSDEVRSKLTVNLVPEGHGAMLEAAKITGRIPIDVVNEALKLYAFVAKAELDGWAPALVRGDDVRRIGIDDDRRGPDDQRLH